ncbi:TIGR04255 family protein [Cereibacter sphaeroides]|uniref:TIGR04255 family protein n=1 Tax=Cereibacter sphaeroides TaxID=1063 RepID=UPI0015591289|nr:TIGR04255 family protein [Cereibacter sphaeroides]
MFVPERAQHALVEVVFGIRLTRAWQPREVQAIKSAHGVWRDLLPRVNDVQVHQVMFGPQGIMQPAIVPATGVAFERVNPDGSIAWRMTFDNEQIVVNCLVYEGWEVTSPIVYQLFSSALTAAGSTDLAISGLFYQTVDQFRWGGEVADYDVAQLLNVESDFVPAHIAKAGMLWHLHQGWFEDTDRPSAGPILKRIHFDATNDPLGGIRMDTLVDKRLNQSIVAGDFVSQREAVDVVEWLHEENKVVLRSFLTEETLQSINLHHG